MRYLPLTVVPAFLALLSAPLLAEPDPSQKRVRVIPRPEASAPRDPIIYETRELTTRDFTSIQLNAVSGNFTFSVGDVEYVYYPRTNEHSTPAADTTACIAVLAELRKVDVVTVRVAVRQPDLPADRKRVALAELTIPIAPLK
jgi:hypothetical protein